VTTEILSIDVSSELETLCRAQLRGTWQVPAEIIRLAERLGVARVSVTRRRLGFEFCWHGPSIDFDQLANLRTALDPNDPPEERQTAIAATEESKMEALLWASGLRGARTRIEACDGRRTSIFDFRYRNTPSLGQGPASESPNSVKIQWRCAGLDRKRALRWLDIATRFVRAEILIDGSPGPTGFAGGLFHVRVENPLPCTLALTRSGDRPVLWLLTDGVVSARASVPGYPPFEAAVELGGIVGTGASAADMRRAVTPYLSELVDRAVWMMVEVSDRFAEMTSKGRDRHCLSLLRAARKGIRTSEICRLALLQNAGDDRCLSVEDLRQLAGKAGGALPAIDESDIDANLVNPNSTLLASGEVREMLTELTGIRFHAPSRRGRRLTTSVSNRFRECVEWFARRIRGRRSGRDLTTNELRPREISTLEAMRTAMSPVDVRFCVGGGSAGRTARGVVVPRENPMIAGGFDLVASDAAWLYPLMLALDAGIEPEEDLRHRWLRVVGTTATKS
jgi:hypothetical protein